MIKTPGLDSVMVSVEFTTGGKLRRAVPWTYELHEKTNRERCQNPVCPDNLRANPGLAVSAGFLSIRSRVKMPRHHRHGEPGDDKTVWPLMLKFAAAPCTSIPMSM